MKHELNCALLDYMNGDRAIDLHWNQAIDMQNRVQNAILPWYEEQEVKLSKARVMEMVDTWKKIWGNTDEDATQAKIDNTAAYLMELANKGR